VTQTATAVTGAAAAEALLGGRQRSRRGEVVLFGALTNIDSAIGRCRGRWYGLFLSCGRFARQGRGAVLLVVGGESGKIGRPNKLQSAP
jgi:hypothetical protein